MHFRSHWLACGAIGCIFGVIGWLAEPLDAFPESLDEVPDASDDLPEPLNGFWHVPISHNPCEQAIKKVPPAAANGTF